MVIVHRKQDPYAQTDPQPLPDDRPSAEVTAQPETEEQYRQPEEHDVGGLRHAKSATLRHECEEQIGDRSQRRLTADALGDDAEDDGGREDGRRNEGEEWKIRVDRVVVGAGRVRDRDPRIRQERLAGGIDRVEGGDRHDSARRQEHGATPDDQKSRHVRRSRL